ncbi:hypothetical protein LTR05_000046 [Lithohypha guttulata]|uniref:Uncharacterized protein n=1 Tax=Lithohypha guttulata TaxID=1690604 RepID=A0AAN7TAF0_9EURO|nr:hypothetical protein LTR05_000046 [Lithohypha guttulata]
MAYNGRPQGYGESQYRSRPANYGTQYNDHDQAQYYDNQVQYQQHHDQDYARYQQDAYDHNQQLPPYQQQPQDQYTAERQHAAQMNPSDHYPVDYDQPQQRQYYYDERFRSDSRNVQQPGRGDRPFRANRQSPETSRPSTSASNHRIKQERILDRSKRESTKAMAWDNPFGVFPGTKKDLEKRKKDAEDVRSQSRADVPLNRPPIVPSSSLHNTTIHHSPPSTNPAVDRPHTSNSRRSSPPTQPISSFNTPLGPFNDVPLRKPLPPFGHDSHSQPATMSDRDRTLPVHHRSNANSSSDNLPPRVDTATTRSHNRAHSLQGQEQISNGYQQSALDYGHDERYTASHPVESRNSPHDYANSVEQNQYASIEAGQMGTRQTQGQARKNMSPQAQNMGLPYRGVASPQRIEKPRESVVPNFAAITPGATENVERTITMQSSGTAHSLRSEPNRRPTYGDISSKPPLIRPGLLQSQDRASPDERSLRSPVDGFDFGLPASRSEPAITPQNSRPILPGDGYGSRGDSDQTSQTPNQYATHDRSNFPPRQESRAAVRDHPASNGFVHSYNQPVLAGQRSQTRLHGQVAPAASGLEYNQTRDALRQEHSLDEQRRPQNYNYERVYRPGAAHTQDTYQQDSFRPVQRTYTEPVGHYDHERRDYGPDAQFWPSTSHGYSQRHYPTDQLQSRPPAAITGQYQEYDQYGDAMIPRPRTANSARAPVRQYPEQYMSALKPTESTLPIADRNHPPPIRPGLLEPVAAPSPTHVPAAAPVPYPQTSPPRTAQNSAPQQRLSSTTASKTPVTLQELNDLRLAFKDRPNDDKLGLKFAKRLVEAASVLASEGGKADAKTTAKNRERYINDAYKIVRKLVAGGSADAMFYLADAYGQGLLGLEANAKEAFQLYTSAAKLQHAPSAYRVAVCCELGQDAGGGTRRDHVKAVQFYKKAAALGDGPAMFKIGMILLKGLLGQQPNRREGISWLKRAAEKADSDNPHALHELALLYENAQSTDVIVRDERYAMQLFTQAANLGYKYSQHRLGTAYEYGTLGAQIDPRMSIAWYSKAAAQNEHQSEFALSGWYLTGSDPLLAQSDTEAYLWARKAAQSGLAKAEYAMGYYSEVGIGCKPDIEEAKKWYFRAAAQLDQRAKERLEEIKRGGAAKRKERISRSNIEKQKGDCVVM